MIIYQPHKKYLSAALENSDFAHYDENRTVIFYRIDGVALTTADETAIETLLVDYDFLAALRVDAKKRIVEQSQHYMQDLEDQYPEFEKRTFPDQKLDVLAWRADSNAATPTLDAIASTRGIDRLTIIVSADTKVTSMHLLATSMTGQRQKFEDDIDNSIDEDFLQAVTFTPPG